MSEEGESFGGALLPLRGLNSAAGDQMMKRNKSMDFIFYMCVTVPSMRNKDVVARQRLRRDSETVSGKTQHFP